MGKSSSIVTLFFTKKSLTKTDRYAGALSWRRRQQLVSHYSGAFTSAKFPKAKKDVSLHFFIHSSNPCKLHQRIAANCTSESPKILKLLHIMLDIARMKEWTAGMSVWWADTLGAGEPPGEGPKGFCPNKITWGKLHEHILSNSKFYYIRLKHNLKTTLDFHRYTFNCRTISPAVLFGHWF